MQTRNRNTFTTIHTEGALLPADLLQRISDTDSSLEGLTLEGYHLAPGEKLNESISRSWNRMMGLWPAFQNARGRLGATDPGTTLTRERWLLPLFQELGYGRLSIVKAVEIDRKSYPISHRWQKTPIHLIGCGLELDKRTPGMAGAARTSPHSLLQEYLNRSDDVRWGLVSNGLSLRILRDNATLTRQAYVDFDLESMFDGEVYSDFALLWLICHQSRFETTEKETECILESWSKSAQEQGTRALDDLRRGVEEAIVCLGQGFLQHPMNGELRARLKQGELSAQDYYRQVLRLVYRMIFLFTAEDRDLLLLPDAPAEAHQRYQKYYSTTRLRSLAERQRGSRHHDRYESLRLVLSLLGSDKGCPEMALPALGGFLFDERSTADLNEARLGNQSLLAAVRSLAFITEASTRRAVDYRNLGPEELGSVYESLLELHPLLNTDAGTFELTSAAGNERKTTGSYYTPSSLIQVLLNSALDPVVEERLKAQSDAASQEQALLSLKVCDPACGSGHFLIAAARRIADRLAQVRAGGDEPSPAETRHALRDVIRHCIYGVDINPMAVELCKVNLWLETIEPGKPLSFLDAHIKCGNSLVGVGPKKDLETLEVPDDAFKAVTGDHKPTATLLRKRNKQERKGQESLFITENNSREDLEKWLAERTRLVEAMPEENSIQVQEKAAAYAKVNASDQFCRQRQIADLWTAAFFWKIEKPAGKSVEIVAPTHGQLRHLRGSQSVQPGLLDRVNALCRSEGFFHWSLEFAEVAAQGGFDCILSNPPWEVLQLKEQEFFAIWINNINEMTVNKRKQEIEHLLKHNPQIASLFSVKQHNSESTNKFIRESKRYPLSAIGKLNTYPLFSENSYLGISKKGRLGIIVPTGIATDDSTKNFFSMLIDNKNLVSLYDFQNSDGLFPGVHRSTKFCLLTVSGNEAFDSEFVFYATNPDQITDPIRKFNLFPSEINLLNPNTHTLPVFRTKADAKICLTIYQRVEILENEKDGKNPWHITLRQGLFNMTTDNHLFLTYPNAGSLPLYEAKMVWQYDHRFITFNGENPSDLSDDDKKSPYYYIQPRYYIDKTHIEIKAPYFIIQRAIADMANEKRAIMSVIPYAGVGHSAYLHIFNEIPPYLQVCYLGCFNTLIIDYLIRQKAQNPNINQFVLKQLPILPPEIFSENYIGFITKRVLELVYSAYDLKAFAEELGYFGDPFIWDEERRAVLRAELDAYYAALYGLNRKQLRYILDPADLTPRELEDILDPREEVRDPLDAEGYAKRAADSNFPGETFRVLKDKDTRQFGEYRTRRLVLEAWDRLEKSGELPGAAGDGKGEGAKNQVFRPRREPKPKPDYKNLYELSKQSTRGGQAEVFQATDRNTGRVVALKRLRDVKNGDSCARMEREITALISHIHANIMPLLEFGKDYTWYSMPLAQYTLFDYIQDNEISPKELGNIIINIAKGLEVAHEMKDFHRDIKPQNILFIGDETEKPRWVIGDWGLVRQTGITNFETSVAEGRAFGTFGFAPPEFWENPHDIDQTADVYSLGRVIAWALTKKNPAPNIPLLPSQQGWDKLVADMTLHDPTKRTPDMATVIARITELCASESDETHIPQMQEVEKTVLIEQQQQDLQPALTDFGLYKCGTCGKMAMGYDLENHEADVHGGKSMVWKKIN